MHVRIYALFLLSQLPFSQLPSAFS